MGRAATLLVLGTIVIGTAACSSDNPSGTGPSGQDDFAMDAISQLETLTSLTVWRVGDHAKGPGRRPDEPIAAVAAHNDLGWAYSVDGDGRFDSSGLPGMSPDASPRHARAAVVHIVEAATGREVRADWTRVDADTWSAEAAFSD